jgi:hypothetical protein
MRLKTDRQIKDFQELVDTCVGNVYLISPDRSDFFNLRSTFSQYIAIDKLLSNADIDWEVHASDVTDQMRINKFLEKLAAENNK